MVELWGVVFSFATGKVKEHLGKDDDSNSSLDKKAKIGS